LWTVENNRVNNKYCFGRINNLLGQWLVLCQPKRFIPKSSLGIDDFALRVTKTLILKVLSGLTLTLEMNDSILKKAI